MSKPNTSNSEKHSNACILCSRNCGITITTDEPDCVKTRIQAKMDLKQS